MAVTNNILTEVGDAVIFKMDYSVHGIDSITGMSDGLTGETGTRFFTKEFRYTLDGLNWGHWNPLSGAALIAIPITPQRSLQIEFKYTRGGTDITGNLVFEWVKVDYTTTIDCDTTSASAFEGSIFSYFFSCCCEEDVKKWCMNVLDKVYKPGLVSKSLTRGVNGNQNFEDEDYIAFWRTVSCFFAMHVVYARGFENFSDDERLLAAWLTNQSFMINRNESLEDMQYVMANLFSVARHRGTPAIGNLKSRGSTVDGAFPNLVQFKEICDEFILEGSKLIWTLDRHSPMYRGIDKIHTRKLYQTDLKSLDLNNFPILPDGDTTAKASGGITNSPLDYISISNVGVGERGGIGFVDPLSPTVAELEFLTSVDSSLSYEIQFMAKGSAAFTVAGYGYSSSLTRTSLDTINPAFQTSEAISRQKLAKDDIWYLVRIQVLPASAPYSGSNQNINSSLGLGLNLRMPEKLCKFAFEISVDRTTPANSEPTVSDTTVSINDEDVYTFHITDFTADFDDPEGDPFGGITLDSIAISGGGGSLGVLTLDGVDITGLLPKPVSADQIAAGLLVYTDGAGTPTQDIELEFTALDNQPQVSVSVTDTLLIKDITFKLLHRPYDVSTVNGINLVESWVKNNSGISNEEIDAKVKQTLIPYSSKNKNNYL